MRDSQPTDTYDANFQALERLAGLTHARELLVDSYAPTFVIKQLDREITRCKYLVAELVSLGIDTSDYMKGATSDDR